MSLCDEVLKNISEKAEFFVVTKLSKPQQDDGDLEDKLEKIAKQYKSTDTRYDQEGSTFVFKNRDQAGDFLGDVRKKLKVSATIK